MSDTEQNANASTSLARPWVIRMVIIIGVLLAFGGWALYDATVAYPARGARVAEFYKFEYLRRAADAGRLLSVSGTLDPRGELETLRSKDALDMSALESAKLDWFEALAVPGLNMLTVENVRVADPSAELERLTSELTQTTKPSDLHAYDILMQWLILAVCWAIGGWMLLLFFMVGSRKFRWAEDSNTLTLPGGRTIAPADLDADDPIDLTKWHKFIVVLQPREGDPVRLDLFRYQPLEDWIRELVKAADPEFQFPDELEDDDDEPDEADHEASDEGGEADEERPEG